jgi:hypothetical protein
MEQENPQFSEEFKSEFMKFIKMLEDKLEEDLKLIQQEEKAFEILQGNFGEIKVASN